MGRPRVSSLIWALTPGAFPICPQEPQKEGRGVQSWVGWLGCSPGLSLPHFDLRTSPPGPADPVRKETDREALGPHLPRLHLSPNSPHPTLLARWICKRENKTHTCNNQPRAFPGIG